MDSKSLKNNLIDFFDNNQIVQKLRRYYKSDFYLVTIAAIILLSYFVRSPYVGAFLIAFVAGTGLIIDKSINALIMPLIASVFIAPSKDTNAENYLFSFNGIQGVLIVMSCLLLLLFAFRFWLYGGILQVFTKKTRLTFYIIPLCAFLLLNGAFAKNYTFGNFIFAVVTSVMWFFIYAFFVNNLEDDKQTIVYFCRCCMYIVLLLIGELVFYYLKYDIIVDGVIRKYDVFFGWGVHNNFGGFMAVLIAPMFYLAYTQKHPWIYISVAILAYISIFFVICRSAMLFGGIIFVVCTFILLLKKRESKAIKRLNITIAISIVCVFVVLLIIFRNKIIELFDILFNADLGDNGRFSLWNSALKAFLEYPLFGSGFYACVFDSWTGGVFPGFYHNTIIELLGCCGIFAIIAYIAYRLKTLQICFYKMNTERLFLGLTIVTLLLVSLLDNHVFNIYPMFVYGLALALAELNYNKTVSESKAPLKNDIEVKE